MKSEDAIAAKGRPFTGAEYLESLRDGREVYIYGERVADVTTHPAFRNAARSVARLYDALHDPRTKDVLTGPTDTGSGGYTPSCVARSPDAAEPGTHYDSASMLKNGNVLAVIQARVAWVMGVGRV